MSSQSFYKLNILKETLESLKIAISINQREKANVRSMIHLLDHDALERDYDEKILDLQTRKGACEREITLVENSIQIGLIRTQIDIIERNCRLLKSSKALLVQKRKIQALNASLERLLWFFFPLINIILDYI